MDGDRLPQEDNPEDILKQKDNDCGNKKTAEELASSVGNNLAEISPLIIENDLNTPEHPATLNQQAETENMEVHHHPNVEKKNFKEYLLEGLMIFLAVTMGFIAENIRETISDHTKEKEYIRSMLGDLQQDTASLNLLVADYNAKLTRLDSAIFLLNSPDIQKYGADLYYYAGKIPRYTYFAITDQTMQQMKNSGTFRLIKNETAIKAILTYYSKMYDVNLLQAIVSEHVKELQANSYLIFNPVVLETMINNTNINLIRPEGNPELLSYEKISLSKITSIFHYLKTGTQKMQSLEVDLKKSADTLTATLKKEYHLENE
jgi:hypothetical protein